jgi:hypothetical protein
MENIELNLIREFKEHNQCEYNVVKE